MEKLSIFIRGEAFLPDISRRYERVGRKVLTIDRCTQKEWVPDGRRSKQFTLQIYEKQRVRASSPCILFPYRPKQKHADAICIGVTGNKREGDRRKPRGRRRNPKNRRVGVGERPLSPPPEGAGEGAGGGAHASSGGTSPRSPPGEGKTPRGPRARNPKNRRGGCRDE